MARSYQYDHFTVPKRDTTVRHGAQKRKLGKQKAQEEVGDAKIHYGKKFAETEELYTARGMEKQLVELDELREAEKRSRQPKKQQAPIGALPVEALESSPEELEAVHGELSELREMAARRGQAVGNAMRDLVRSATKLGLLPVEAVRILGARLNPRKA